MRKVAQLPLKRDRNNNIVVCFHKDLYSPATIKRIIKTVEGLSLKVTSGKYLELGLKTSKKDIALEFCNYLFSEQK